MTLIDWFLNGDTGISSKTILAVMIDSEYPHADVPKDAADFGRCYKLLALFPEFRKRMDEVSDKYKAWQPLVREWESLMKLYETDKETLNKRLDALNDEGLTLDGWTRTEGGWQRHGERILLIGKATIKNFNSYAIKETK